MKTQIAMDFNIGTNVFFPQSKKNRKYGLELGTNIGFLFDLFYFIFLKYPHHMDSWRRKKFIFSFIIKPCFSFFSK